MGLSDKVYKAQFKEMRPFLNFNINLSKKLSPSDKRIITIYYNEFLKLNSYIKIKVFRSRNINNVKAVQKMFHEHKTSKGWKVAFVPYTSTTAPNISVSKNGKIKTYNKRTKLSRLYIPIIDRLAFITDTRNYCEELLRIFNVTPRQKLQVMTGDFLSSEIFEAEILPEIMEEWVERYAAEEFIRGFVSPLTRK